MGFGNTSSVSKTSVKAETTVIDNTTLSKAEPQLSTSTLSVQDYFAQKMAKFTSKQCVNNDDDYEDTACRGGLGSTATSNIDDATLIPEESSKKRKREKSDKSDKSDKKKKSKESKSEKKMKKEKSDKSDKKKKKSKREESDKKAKKEKRSKEKSKKKDK